MTLSISTTVRNDIANRLAADFSSGTLDIWSGTPPASADVAVVATGLLVKLGTIILPAQPFTTASSASIALNGTWSATAIATGTAAWFRLKDPSATYIIQGTISTTVAGTGDAQMTTTAIVAGGVIQVTSFTLTMG